MTLGAWEGGPHLGPQHQGLEGGQLLEDFFPWVVLNNSALVLRKGQGRGEWFRLRGIACDLSCLN